MNISNTANTWLSQFKIDITSNANRVYGNGRQQLEATVSVTPNKNKPLTAEQLASITLVTFDDDGVYRELGGALHASPERNPLYEYFAASGNAPSNLELGSNVRRKRFYISSSRRGGSLDQVFARISRDENTHHVTGVDSFKTSIIIESITPVHYDENDFELSAEDELTTDTIDVDIYYLKFKNPRLRIVKARPYTEYYGEPWNDYYNADAHYRYCYATRTGAEHAIIASWRTHYAFEVGPRRPFTLWNNTVFLNRIPGQMNFVRTITHERAYTLRPQGESQRSIWGLFDQYGNERKIEVTQTDDGNRIGFKRFD